jgi:ribosomal protein S18 acetylase RimI-like enzyme
MKDSDVSEVVTTHLESFPGFFLSFLGSRFLTLLYRGVLADAQGISLVACSNNRVDGFVVGVVEQRGFYRNLIRKQWWKFGFAAIGAVLRRPMIIPRLLRALKQPESVGECCAAACLMSIAVHPRAEGRGLGRTLVEAFSAEARRRGLKAYCLTTDRDGNDRVNRFYQRLGFRLGRTYVTPEGRATNEYVISLESQ